MNKRNYWGYRVDKNKSSYFYSELLEGRLRQGWGWDPRQALDVLSLDEGAKRNLPIYKKVKAGDILLVPRIPTWSDVTIVEATADFDTGYSFNIDPNQTDYGHIFPAKIVGQFVRKNKHVSGAIRSTLKNVSRFWKLKNCGSDIEYLISLDSNELQSEQSFTDKYHHILSDSFSRSFDGVKFKEELFDRLNAGFSNEEWEYVLVEGLKQLFPSPMSVERTGGITEKHHGTDILIKIPSLGEKQYGIAIQVKDYEGKMTDSAITQVSKADEYWSEQGIKIIDKFVIVTKSTREENVSLPENKEVTVIFAHDLKSILAEIATSQIGFL